ncbi:unnamed protein product [Rhizoctonia solani]|uniref:Uncharacterized protein n=1 Tax=Rhizoctonia solani TaxID=456999 RepID=A0A8H3DT99_9AGAM|nr:unnamed protein product [Rhizoctonia solani]
MAEGDPRMDVFGAVEPVVTHHSREQAVVDDSPSASGIPSSARGSRRTQSVDVSSTWIGFGPHFTPTMSDLLLTVRRTDPRIASDVLALERRFAAASKGKSPSSRDRPHRAHRVRHSLPVTPGRDTEPLQLSTLQELSSPIPEADNASQFSDPKSPTRLVGPALPSSGIPAPSPSPPQPDPPPSDPPLLKVDAPAYTGLLPNSDPEHTSASGHGPKRTSKAAKRTSLTAMLGLTGRKKHKDGSGQEDDSTHLSVRPLNRRVDTQHTMRTFNTVYTTATAGSGESGDRASLGVGSSPGHGPSSSPGQGARSASGASSNPGLGTSPSLIEHPTIEPSAKTLARAAATRDQLAKRYGMIYANLDTQAAGSPAPGLNPLEVLRWRASTLQEARKSAEAGRNGMDGGNDEVWEREVERRVRDAPPAFQGTSLPAFLGNSLPEANSLSWLPYLEPLFLEERTRADGIGGMGRDEFDAGQGMTAWYVLASFVEGYVASREQATSRPESFGSDFPKSLGSEGHKSIGSDAHKSFVSDGKSLPEPTSHSKPKDVREQAIVNAAYARRSAGTGTGAVSDDASASGSRFAIIDRAFRTRSKSSVVVDTFNRSRQGSLGVNSEPPSPSHVSSPIPPVPSSQTSQSYNGKPSKLVDPTLSRSGSQTHHHHHRHHHSRSQSQARSISAGNHHHSRSQSQARSISAGNGPKQSTNDFGVLVKHDGKSTSPASSRLNLANFIIGGAAVLGLNMRRGARQPLAKDGNGNGISGSENEGERMSSDCSPSDVDLYAKRHGGLSDGEGGRVKRRKKTWREREGGEVPLSDGDREIGKNVRLEKVVLEFVEPGPEVTSEDKGREEYGRKRVQGPRTLVSFARLLGELNDVHQAGSDVFGDMFTAIPPKVVHALAPDLSDTDESVMPTTPTYDPLISFAKHLETASTAVDHVGRMKLDADLPIAAFDALHTLEDKLAGISKQVADLRAFCDQTEEERKYVKSLYENTAGNVGTTYPECTQIEQLLGSLVTEDMPWLPSWLPLWVRHLLEIFSGQIQFLVENGLRIYGYLYSGFSLISLVFNLFISLFLFVARFVRSYWFGFLAVALAGVGYLMMVPPEGVEVEL